MDKLDKTDLQMFLQSLKESMESNFNNIEEKLSMEEKIDESNRKINNKLTDLDDEISKINAKIDTNEDTNKIMDARLKWPADKSGEAPQWPATRQASTHEPAEKSGETPQWPATGQDSTHEPAELFHWRTPDSKDTAGAQSKTTQDPANWQPSSRGPAGDIH